MKDFPYKEDDAGLSPAPRTKLYVPPKGTELDESVYCASPSSNNGGSRVRILLIVRNIRSLNASIGV